jgi:hypothetical protein
MIQQMRSRAATQQRMIQQMHSRAATQHYCVPQQYLGTSEQRHQQGAGTHQYGIHTTACSVHAICAHAAIATVHTPASIETLPIHALPIASIHAHSIAPRARITIAVVLEQSSPTHLQKGYALLMSMPSQSIPSPCIQPSAVDSQA